MYNVQYNVQYRVPLLTFKSHRSLKAALGLLLHSNANSHSPLWIPTPTTNLCLLSTENETKNCIIWICAALTPSLLSTQRSPPKTASSSAALLLCSLLMMGSGGYLIFHLIALVISSSSSEKIIGFQVSAKISGEECVLDSLILIYSSTGFHLFMWNPKLWHN